MNITPAEAAQALSEIEASRVAMRRAIRSTAGHVYLWIWGTIWMLIAALGCANLVQAHPNVVINSICGLGIVASVAFGAVQARRMRCQFDMRFLGVCGMLLLFSYIVWPSVIGFGPLTHSLERSYAYSCLIFMQLYIVAGILFDNILLWVGLVITALLLAGLLLLPALFWPACLASGAVLVATGFHARRRWSH
ncbi:MAG TPA: hypothetical protein VGG34_06215 [Opitutaceae bacterium]|jgi:hypothetical protein